MSKTQWAIIEIDYLGCLLIFLQSKVIVFSLFVCVCVCVCVFPCVRVEVIHGTLWYHEVFMYYLLGSTYFEPHQTTFSHIQPLLAT